MNWHNVNKYILRRVTLLVGVIMWLILINKVNFLGAKVVAKYGEIKVFTEEWFLADITVPFTNLFFRLFFVFFILMFISWKGFGEYKKSGIWLYNGAIGALAGVLVGYICTSLFAIRFFSWYAIVAGVVAVILIVYLVANICYYTRHKEGIVGDKSITLPIACFAVVVIAIIILSNSFAEKYQRVWNKTYNAICEHMETWGDGLSDEEITYVDYIKLQHANYFHPEGKTFTVEEFEDAVRNYNSGEGSWYVLWYVWDSRTYSSFWEYDYEENIGWHAYVKFVVRELEAKGIEPKIATYEEMDVACQYVYEVQQSQVERTIIGDEKGEIVINIEIPESNNPEDIIFTYEGEGYYAVIDEWYEVEDEDEKIYGREDIVTTFEPGCVYKARVNIYPRISYLYANDYDDIYVEYTGVGVITDDEYIMPYNVYEASGTICIEIDN